MMNEAIQKLYAELVEQREELVRELDALADTKQSGMNTIPRASITEQRLQREIQWRESQVIALLGGIVHWEFNG